MIINSIKFAMNKGAKDQTLYILHLVYMIIYSVKLAMNKGTKN